MLRGVSERVIEFFFDIGSPYSYLAATRIPLLEQSCGVPVRWRPFLLGGVFKASGNAMPARVASKAAWMQKDLDRWARHYEVSFKMSTRFPLNTLMTQRSLVAAGRIAGEDRVAPFAMKLFEAYWVEDRNVSDPEEIERIAESAGLDAAALIAATSEQQSKDLLRASTEEAVQRGEFGAPTFFVDHHMFWGNDRIPMLEALLAG